MTNNRILLLMVLVLSFWASSCSKDEPKEPETDFSKLPPLEKVLPGIWVSVSDDNTIRRYEFSDDGHYTSIKQNLDSHDTPLNIGGGKYEINAEKGSVQLNPTVIGPNTSRIISLSTWSDSMFSMSSAPGKEERFIRVSESYLLKLGQTILPDYKELFETEPLTDISVINPDILKSNNETGKFQVTGYGVGYIVMNTDLSARYIEIVSSPILELPSFDSLLQCTSNKECDPIVESITRKPGICSIDITWNGTNQFRWVEWVTVTFKDNVPPQAILMLCASKYPKIILPKGEISFSNQEGSSFTTYDKILKWNCLHEIKISK